jgi:iron complex transport system substrate-binding protein
MIERRGKAWGGRMGTSRNGRDARGPTTKLIGLVAALMMLAVVCCGCTVVKNDDGKKTITVTDDYGRTVKVAQGAKRIISLAPSDSEIIYALGIGDKVVAVDNNTNYPSETASKPKVSGYKWLDMETILGLKPDIVFAADINKDVISQLEERGLTTVVLNPKNVSNVFDNIRFVGKIMGMESKGKEVASALDARVKAVTGKALAQGVAKPRVYLELDAFMGYYTYGPGTFGDELISLAGGVNIAHDQSTQYPPLANEFIVASDPQVIIYQTGPWTTTTPQGIVARTGWGNVTAVRDSRLFGVDGDLVSRAGPRVVDALEAMAKDIHPEIGF